MRASEDMGASPVGDRALVPTGPEPLRVSSADAVTIAGAKPYRPSNGTEGEWFEARFCDQCDEEMPWRDTDGQVDACSIHCRALAFSIGDKDYPAEWIEDADGPRCTAYRPEGTPSVTEASRDRARYEAAMAEMRAAQGMSTGTAKTPKAVEARRAASPVPPQEGCAP